MEVMLTSPLLRQVDTLPERLTSIKPDELHTIFPQPTLMHLPGRIEQPLFISVLQHGNESTGFLAVQALLNKYMERDLPRSISIFFSNVLAAKEGLRRLDHQPDYNRIWPGTEAPAGPETIMTQQVVDEMVRRRVFASIDIHNNTGLNPHYGCVNRLDPRYLQLANIFSRLVVYFIRPKGVQSAAFAQLCPAVTLECGKPGQAHGVEHALEYLDTCLHLITISEQPAASRNIDLFHTVAQVTIPDSVSFSFEEKPVDFRLVNDLDYMNFTEIPAETVIGSVRDHSKIPLLACHETGDDVTSDYFEVNDDGDLVLKKNIMPSMLTLDERVIRQDCLCYIMERIDVSL
jgi:succinylglutamate desuccinylase